MVTRLLVLLAVLKNSEAAAAQTVAEPAAHTTGGWIILGLCFVVAFPIVFGLPYFILWLKSLPDRTRILWRVLCANVSKRRRRTRAFVRYQRQTFRASIRKRQHARRAQKLRPQMEAFALICIDSFRSHFQSTPDRTPLADVVYAPLDGTFQLKLRVPDQRPSWINDRSKVREKLNSITAEHPDQPFVPADFNSDDNGSLVVSFRFHPQRMFGGVA